VIGGIAVAIAAWAGDFVVVSAVAIVASAVVGAFELGVAWRLPYRPKPTADDPRGRKAPRTKGPAPTTALTTRHNVSR
jgi:hypothetical protein